MGEKHNDLTEIIAQALNEMKKEQGERFDIQRINLAELERRTGITRARLRRLKSTGFVDRPHALTGRKSESTLLTGFTGIIDGLLKKGVTNSAVILLSGLPVLNNTLNLGIHEPLRQRLVMNYNLDGLSKEEGNAYISQKLKGAGCDQPVFDANAMEAILNSANGIPRLINKICNASLLVGNSRSLNVINADAVMQAVSDIQLG